MHRSFPTALAALALLCAAPATALAQDDDDFDDDEEWMEDCRDDASRWSRRERRARHCEIRETGLRAPGGTLRVDPGRNGGVAVRAWDRDSIHVIARIQTQAYSVADAEAMAREVKVTTSGTITAAGPDNMGRNEHWSVTFVVYAPRRSNLDLATENGPLSVRGISGSMTLSAQNGPVALQGVAGDVRARVRNGPLSVELAGSRWEGAGLDAEATNGPAVLSIPDGYSANLETGTVNGPMSVDFPLTVTFQGRLSQRLSSKLGDGGAPVRVVTTNGPMVIRRRGRI